MFKNIYILKIKDKKSINRLIKYHVYIENIKHDHGYYYLYVDYDNYCKLLKYKDRYNITLVNSKGINKYKYLSKKYFLFFISNIIGLILLFLLSNIIFKVEISTNNKEIRAIIDNELKYYGIEKRKFVKSYQEKEIIKKNILNDNKDKIEWLEITRIGSLYKINVLERIINKEDKDLNYYHLVAKKNAIIKDIKATSGSIVKKVNDYVNKGDIIVSGLIMKGDNIVNKVKAKGIIYGETWYNVSVTLPINYYDKIYTGQEKKRLVINYFNKNIKLFDFNSYKKEEIINKVLFSNRLLPISISYSTIKEILVINDIYTYDKAVEVGINLAREKLLETLSSSSQILSQKKLKLYEKDSRIVIEVFFKVYEDITDYAIIKVEGE